MTLHQKSYSVNWCVFTWRTIKPSFSLTRFEMKQPWVFRNMRSWSLSWKYDYWCRIRKRVKFHPNPIRNDGILGFFEKHHLNKKNNTKNNKVSSDIGIGYWSKNWKTTKHDWFRNSKNRNDQNLTTNCASKKPKTRQKFQASVLGTAVRQRSRLATTTLQIKINSLVFIPGESQTLSDNSTEAVLMRWFVGSDL